MNTSYRWAEDNILCECPKCFCPSSKNALKTNNLKRSFRYVDNNKKIIYFNIPKCASTTIISLLFNDTTSSLNELTYPLSTYFKFAFVRNPWDRVVSNWKMFTTMSKRIQQLKSMTNKDLSRFEDFIAFIEHNTNHHWVEQRKFLPESLDFMGKIENFNNDFNVVCNNIGIQYKTKKLNGTKHEHYSKYYSPNLIDKVAKMYKKDISLFDYEFERL